jgi:hypothetical protein
MNDFLKVLAVIVSLIIILGLSELIKVNSAYKDANKAQQDRIESLQSYKDSIDTIIELSLLNQSLYQSDKEFNQNGLELHTQTKIKYVTKTIPNYIDIIDMSSVDKRDSISAVIRRTDPISTEFFHLLDSSITKQRYNEVSLRP